MVTTPLLCMCGQSQEAWEAKLDKARAVEREVCAKIAEGWHDNRDWQAPHIAEAIRTRLCTSQ